MWVRRFSFLCVAATAKQLGEMGLVLDIFPLTEVINDVIMLYYDHRDAADHAGQVLEEYSIG